VNTRARSPFLHVANGTATTALIEKAGIPGRRSIWSDPLYEGPVPGGISDAKLVDVRSRYLSNSDTDDVDQPLEDVDPVNDLRRWRETIAAHESYDELVLWFEHDLFDQLNLIQLLSWMREQIPAGKTVTLICIGSFPGRPAFKGLGELSPEELAPLFETRQPVSAAQYNLAVRAWRAFREPTPEALDEFRHTDTSALPYLAAALERFVQEYPWTIDGLSRTERRLLRLAEPGPIGVRTIFPRMHVDEHAYYVTDCSLGALVTTLSTTSPPLLAIVDGTTPDRWSLDRTVALTDAGREVVAGRRDRVACGMDRWLGGVHLQSGASVWRWDDQQRRICIVDC
jgi:hypothetical protein